MTDGPTLAELGRIVTELAARLGGLLPREVYDAHREGLLDRLARLDQAMRELAEELRTDRTDRAKEAATTRRMVYGAALAAVFTVVVNVVLAVAGLK